MLYDLAEQTGCWLQVLRNRLNVEDLPLYLVLSDIDIFTGRYLGTSYPEGRTAALDIAGLFRNALGYPVKKVRCRTAVSNRNAN